MKDTAFAAMVARNPQAARDYNRRMEAWCDAWFTARLPADELERTKESELETIMNDARRAAIAHELSSIKAYVDTMLAGLPTQGADGIFEDTAELEVLIDAIESIAQDDDSDWE